MNDVRNLMDNLHAHVEYKEFDTGQRASGDGWSVLERIRHAADGERAPPPVEDAAAAPAAFAQAPAPAPAPAPTPAPGALAAARNAVLNRASLLKRYASAPAADGEPLRRLPLADVFARLERPGR